MEVRKPNVKIIWNGKDVTKDVSKYTSSVNYTDREEGMSDDLTISFDNSNLIWSLDWYPTEGDTIELYIGYEELMYCGLFTVDDITLSGPPDLIEVKALAAGITKALRTRNNKAFEDLSLKSIAQFFCTKHGLDLVEMSSISGINLPRKTQENKTDLSFLSELAKEYGFIFSIRGTKLVFISYSDLDNLEAIKDLDKTEVSNYSINQKTYDTYASAEFKARNKNTDEIIKVTSQGEDTVLEDVYIIEGDAKDNVTATAKANAGLWNKNKFKQTARIVVPGDPELVSGVNFNLTGLGQGSGKYHITMASHTIADSYVTTMDLRKTGTVPAPKMIPK